MAYTPTTWKTGDKVTAEKLNKIEQGIVDAEQSGSSLPDYSEANNGDVLTINNGEPKWLTGSGGDMTAAVYDPDGGVADAGGIAGNGNAWTIPSKTIFL